MKKLLLTVLIGTMIGLCLIGCGKHSNSEHPSDESSSSEHPE